MSDDRSEAPRGLMDEDGRLEEDLVLGDVAPERDDAMSWKKAGPIGQAMVVVAACLVAVFALPGLESFRPWHDGDPLPFWNVIQRPFQSQAAEAKEERAREVDAIANEVLAAPEPPPPPAAPPKPVVKAEEIEKLPPFSPGPDDEAEVVQSIELFTGHELDHYFLKLAKADTGIEGTVVRALHWGDSAIGMDGIPSAIRRRLQNRFGDAGHGFHLMAPPNSSYRHPEVSFSTNDGWRKCFIIYKCRSDGHYGLGGTTFKSSGGAKSSFAPSAKRSSGRVSKFDLYYAAQPKGGNLTVQVDDGEKVVLDTAAEQLEDRFHTIEVEDGEHELEVRAAGGGPVRVFGVTLERDGPGVVWDSAALVGAFTKRMSELDPDHLAAQLNHRQTDLAVFTFGGNDMVRKIKMSTYEDEYRAVVQLVRKARPDMDCLIMSPLDHGERNGVRIVSRPVVARMVEAQRNVARAEGCAFFDTYAAMGGDGSAGRWFKHKPRLISGDLGHATAKGHQVIGELVFRAIVERYVEYRKRRDTEGGIAADE